MIKESIGRTCPFHKLDPAIFELFGTCGSSLFNVNPDGVVSKNTNETKTLVNRGISDRRVSALIGNAR